MKCSFCNKNSIYTRRNEGKSYCDDHFKRDIEKKVKKTLSKYRMIRPGDKVAIALSGGKDSANVLYLLKNIFHDNPKIEFIAITLDQGIRGETEKNIKIAKKFCKKLGVPHYVFSFKEEFKTTVDEIKKEGKGGFCTVCGAMRRSLLNEKARNLGCNKVATGHNLDDECQSILMNILKGDLIKLSRTGAVPGVIRNEGFVPRIKPLIMVQEEESRLFAELNGMDVNYCACTYAKFNSLRGESKIFLKRIEEKSPGLKYSLLEATNKLVSMMRPEFKKEKINECIKCGEPTSQKICKKCIILEGVSA